MQIYFRPLYIAKQGVDNCYGLIVSLNDGKKEAACYHLALPTTESPKDAVRKLRELARWIEKEAK